MNTEQLEEVQLLERELREIGNLEKAQYKRQTIAQASRLLRDLTREDGWRPIETAPKDGSFVLLAGDSGYVSTPLRVEVGRWEDHDGRAGGSWRNHAHDRLTDGGDEPIYWMPLPRINRELQGEE